MVAKSSTALYKIQSDQRVDSPLQTSYFPEIYLIKFFRWPFVVVETSKSAPFKGGK